MIVALAIFSLAALALLRLQGATVAQTAMLDDRLLGQIVARNAAVETLTDPVAPPLGASSGEVTNGGRQWRWARQTRRTADQRIVRVDIAVTSSLGETVGALTVVRGLE